MREKERKKERKRLWESLGGWGRVRVGVGKEDKKKVGGKKRGSELKENIDSNELNVSFTVGDLFYLDFWYIRCDDDTNAQGGWMVYEWVGRISSSSSSSFQFR